MDGRGLGERMNDLRRLAGMERISAVILKYRLTVFYIVSIVYLELVYRLWNIKNLGFDFVFAVIFAVSAGAFLSLLSGLFNARANRLIAIVLFSALTLCYNVQLIYFGVFHTPFSFYSLAGAGDVIQFGDIIWGAVLSNLVAVILIFLPLIVLLTDYFAFTFERIRTPAIYHLTIFCTLSYGVSILGVNLTGDSNVSQYTLYYKTYSPELSVGKLGLLTTMRLDLQKLVFGFDAVETLRETEVCSSAEDEPGEETAARVPEPVGQTPSETENPPPQQVEGTVFAFENKFNTMEIDFASLAANEKDPELLDMHRYFSSVEPTGKNRFTGLFKGNNLILFTAESFSPYAVDPVLTPTLYKMSTEGFVFNNFYNPVWGVSTSDGEYVACTGLIPKAGVWSFARSGQNFMPFVMGNQFKKLGYPARAYHDHTYTYYKRNISHPNMGYVYKAVGNGLEIKKTWPESDLEMIEATAPEYIGSGPFHTYYMTVSGHLQYSFEGNYIAGKNKNLVEGLAYSDISKAYIASNLELEFAVKSLLDKLEEAGIAENTVIALSPDHYPYGLPKENIDEIAGHRVEDNFELYKSKLIIWKKGMEPVVVDKPCSSLDINPTLSNLFGLEYDSRLLMGRDILSDTPPLVIFSNWSWITDRARYNSKTNRVEFTDGTEKDTAYVRKINRMVADRYKYSVKILENDYYARVVPR